MRCALAVALALAACASPTPPAADRRAGSASAFAAPRREVRPRPQVGAHGAPIAQVAVASDGTAALTADQSGALRLWPALDGTREPIVIAATPPRDLAVAHAGGGYVVALLDSANAVSLLSIAADGVIEHRASIADVRELHLLASGVLLAVQPDESIGFWDARGTRLGRLAARPGQRIVEVAVRGDHALALLAAGTARAGRAIDGFAWGDEVPYRVDLGHVVLGPGAIASIQDLRWERPVAFEPATGRVVGPLCTGQVIGFAGERTVACSVDGALQWWTIDRATSKPIELAIPTPARAAMANDRAVIAFGESLALATPDGPPRYVGYAMSGFRELGLSPLGTVIGYEKTWRILDADLGARRPLDVADIPSFGLDAGPHAPRDDSRVAFDPETRLVAMRDGDTVTVAHYEARDLVRRSRLVLPPLARPFDLFVYATDPAAANGVAVITVSVGAGDLVQTVSEFTAADLARGSGLVPPHRTYAIHDGLRFVDRAGRVLVGDDEIVTAMTGSGPPAYTLHVPSRSTVLASPHGSYVLVRDADRLAMYDTRTAQPIWTTGEKGVRDLQIQPNGDVLLVVGGAIVALDGLTGAVRERRCGWGFGLTDTPPPSYEGLEDRSACDVED